MTPRGGAQIIPRPESSTPGGPPPWADLAPDERVVDLAALPQRLAALGEPIVIDGPVPVAHRRHSAVLAPLYGGDEGATVILTRRAGHLRNHRGEVSFPGGRHEEDDADLVATALRETQEEIGLDPASVRVVGELDRLSTYVSRSMIHPYVGVLDQPPQGLEPDPSEVEQILPVPFADLLDDEAYREEVWVFPDGVERRMFFFELDGDTVWGATARMLHQLLSLGLGLDPRG